VPRFVGPGVYGCIRDESCRCLCAFSCRFVKSKEEEYNSTINSLTWLASNVVLFLISSSGYLSLDLSHTFV
jgi:hypothetical protein